MNKPPIHNKDIAYDELEQSYKGEGIAMFSNAMGNPLNANEMLRESVNSLSSESKPTCDDSTRNIYFVDQQRFQFILTELSSLLQTEAQKRDELLKRIEEESNERSKANGKTELG